MAQMIGLLMPKFFIERIEESHQIESGLLECNYYFEKETRWSKCSWIPKTSFRTLVGIELKPST